MMLFRVRFMNTRRFPRSNNRSLTQTSPRLADDLPLSTFSPSPSPCRRKMSSSSSSSSRQQEQSSLENQRKELLLEAKSMSLSVWRTSLRCLKIMRPGNEKDEKNFVKRETDFFNGTSTEMMPVDRENELSSRDAYYYHWAKENFEQESDVLDRDPWMERDVERYLHLIRKAEDTRKWVLRDYEFEDPFPNSFSHERVDIFEAKIMKFLRQSYLFHGYNLPENLMNEEEINAIQKNVEDEEDDDDFWLDEDDDDDKGEKQ